MLLKLEGVGADVASVTFEAINVHGYRTGVPVVVTEAPWEAQIAVNRKGKVTGRATVTRSGGDVEKAMEATVEGGAPLDETPDWSPVPEAPRAEDVGEPAERP